MPKYLVYSLLWCMSGDGKLKVREQVGDYIQKITTIPLPPSSAMPIVDYEVILVSNSKALASSNLKPYLCTF